MALDPNINTLEKQKFRDAGIDLSKVAVEVENDSSSPVPVDVVAAENPSVINTTSPIATDTEFSISLPSNTKKFIIKTRTNAELKINFSSGFTSWFTIPERNSFYEENLKLSSSTIYLKCNKSAVVVEILAWV